MQHPGDAHYLHVISTSIIARYITGLGNIQYSDLTPLALLGTQYLAAAVHTDHEHEAHEHEAGAHAAA